MSILHPTENHAWNSITYYAHVVHMLSRLLSSVHFSPYMFCLVNAISLLPLPSSSLFFTLSSFFLVYVFFSYSCHTQILCSTSRYISSVTFCKPFYLSTISHFQFQYPLQDSSKTIAMLLCFPYEQLCKQKDRYNRSN